MPELNKELIVIFKENSFEIDTDFTNNKEFYYDKEQYEDFKRSPIITLFRFGFIDKNTRFSPSLSFLHKIAVSFVKRIAMDPDIEITRTPQTITEEILSELIHNIPFAIGAEFIDRVWITSLWDKLSAIFMDDISKYLGSVSEYLKEHDSNLNIAGRVFFHLVENKTEEEYPFAFLATYSTNGTDGKKVSHMPLKNALLEFKNKDDLLLQLLSTVSKAADKSDFISELVESGELFSPLKFTTKEAYAFLKEIPLYEECGILCRIPDWWKKKYNSLKLSISIGEKVPSKVGMDALLQFEPKLYLGDTKITKQELQQLLIEANGLALIKGKWVEVDPEKLKSTLEAYEKAYSISKDGELTMAEAMRAQLTIQKDLDIHNENVVLEVSNGTWLKSMKDKLLDPAKINEVMLGDNFMATLRNYQQTGFQWLNYMKELGFGALLADDMGLGKTLQVLALLEYIREYKRSKSLLILPASLIGNWQKEISKFAPMLKYKLLHTGKNETVLEELSEELNNTNLYITTYGMATRLRQLQEYQWDLVILDEAQAIKNPNTKQTKTMKQIPARFKIAITGTPIENRLSDLWSIFDFLNQGLLGTSKEFLDLTKQLSKEGDYTNLRTVISPFILRRLKTDKTIICDLPDKVEVNAYTTLTKKQIMLYKLLVEDLEKNLKYAEGIERKGLVLSSIIKFKQICNHPDQYLGQKEYDALLSGKFEKLKEICEIIYEKRERVLVFTQFKEMTGPIANFLETVFERKGLVLHGSTKVNKRSELVDEFCGEEYVPFMVLSLKAGGVGLNLTAANHVIHFDRWWNPAIENQATDRAFRIGQKKNVVVHKFITSGTLEEKIDAMILEKQKLASDIIVASGETWITELSNDELLSMFRLS